jgi:hypothetical protein
MSVGMPGMCLVRAEKGGKAESAPLGAQRGTCGSSMTPKRSRALPCNLRSTLDPILHKTVNPCACHLRLSRGPPAP